MSSPANRFSRFTMVTPNWNGQAYLKPCLESVLDQDYPDLEYVVVDGESTDGSRALIERYRSDLAGFICEKDDGHADALNKGFAASSGEIMGWINSDDTLLPGTLHFVNRLFQARPDIDWITGRPSSMNADGQVEWMGAARPWSRLRFLSGDCEWIQQESTFWRRSLWDAAGGRLDTDFSLANDFELWTRFFRYAELHTVDRPLGCFRVRPGQRSIVFKARYDVEADAVLRRELDRLEPEFRAAFGDLIPDRPRRLDAADRARLDGPLSACDPPIIRARTPRQLKSRARRPARPGAEAALDRAGAASDLAGLKDAHAGKRCFILADDAPAGSGQLALLKDEVVFAGAPVAAMLASLDWRPAGLAVMQADILTAHAALLDAVLRDNPDITGFLPAWIETGEARPMATRAVLAEAENRLYLDCREPETEQGYAPVAENLDAAIARAPDTATTLVQIATWMGFSHIYLIGGMAGTQTADFPVAPEEHWRVARQALDARGVSLQTAALEGEEETGDGALEAVAFISLFDEDQIHERRAAAARRRERKPGYAGLRTRLAERFHGDTSRAGRLVLSAWRNRVFLAGGALFATATGAALALAPSLEARALILAVAAPAGVLAFAMAAALKARRLFGALLAQIVELQKREASRELRLIELEIRLEDVRRWSDGMDKD